MSKLKACLLLSMSRAMLMSNFDLKKLAKKFPEEDIEWRIQQCGKGGNNNYWAMIIPYITNRAIMQRLDDVVGPGFWKNEFKATPCNTGYQCGISIKIDGEWVTRWDGSEVVGAGNIDKVKSTMSAAMKRTGVQWGIGRYLYQFETEFAVVQHCDNRRAVLEGFTWYENKNKKERFQWKAPALKAWALPVTEKEVMAYIDAMEQAEDANTLKGVWSMAYKAATAENDDEMMGRFIKAKDNAKQRLVSESESKADDNYKAICKVVTEQIDIINSATNESSVNGLKGISLDKIKLVARGDNLAQAIKEIKHAAVAKINKLKGE